MITNTVYNQIVVFGAGGVGGCLAGLLAAGINRRAVGLRQLHIIDQGPHLAAIQAGGITVRTEDGGIVKGYPNTAKDNPVSLPPIELLILAVRLPDLSTALEGLREKVFSSTVILPLIDGPDVPERIRDRLDRGIILPAYADMDARVTAPGEITLRGAGGRIVAGNPAAVFSGPAGGHSHGPGPGSGGGHGHDHSPGPGGGKVYPDGLFRLALEGGFDLFWEEDPEAAIWRRCAETVSAALGELWLEDGAQRTGLVRQAAEEILLLAGTHHPAFRRDASAAIGEYAGETAGGAGFSFRHLLEDGTGRAGSELAFLGKSLLMESRIAGIKTPALEKLLGMI